MKKLLLIPAIAFMAITSVSAQFNYTFSVQTGTYQTLNTGATSINDTTMWDDEEYEIPMGFTFDIDGRSTDTFYFSEAIGFTSGISDTGNLFYVTDLDLHDRGNAGDTVTRSPIRYRVDGTAGNRIFKAEVANAGIYDEYDIYVTNDDSIYYQIWLYEGTNVVEIHFGPSNVTLANYSDYYFATGSPILGYVKNVINSSGSFDMMYYLQGASTAPTIDSANSLFSLSGGLTTHPANGTIYRFTPKPADVKSVKSISEFISIVNNPASSELVLKSTTKEPVRYHVVSVNGASMSINGTIENGTNKIDVSTLASGMYLLQLTTEKSSETLRFIKQ